MRSGFSSQLHPYILNKIWFFSCDRILKQAIYVPDFSTSQNRVAPVASCAILGDDNINWRPSQFGYDLFGCTVDFQFPVIKLLDYKHWLSELEASRNPFATVVMAHECSSANPQ
ncbi:hypothetical protein [Nostoc commune]|uniref:hypothetical protein n=1 Tax=Nostoc commune TaxID=1178 RepID=UPI000D58C8F4|nr:hypothetical protein [Nostoc commune]